MSGGLQLPLIDGDGVANLFKRAKALRCSTSMDVTWDSSGRWLELLEDALPHLDLFLPSENEAAMLSGYDTPEAMADFVVPIRPYRSEKKKS